MYQQVVRLLVNQPCSFLQGNEHSHALAIVRHHLYNTNSVENGCYLLMAEPHNITTIIFDFDLTISQQHLHNKCAYLLRQLPSGLIKHQTKLQHDKIQKWDETEISLMWEKLQHDELLIANGKASDWRRIFITLLDQHYQIFIASFSSFGSIIKLFLQHIIQLPDEYMRRIHIESWLPINQDNKNLHIDRIVSGTFATPIARSVQRLSKAERKKYYEQIILIDDSLANLHAVATLVGDQHVIAIPHGKNAAEIIMHALNKRLNVEFG